MATVTKCNANNNKQLHQPVQQHAILATLRLQVSCTGLQNYTIRASLLGIRIRIPKSNIPKLTLIS